jgi:hypothetical protein
MFFNNLVLPIHIAVNLSQIGENILKIKAYVVCKYTKYSPSSGRFFNTEALVIDG